MKRISTLVLLAVTILIVAGRPPLAVAQTTQPTDPAATAALDRLRDALKDAYQKGDVDGVLKFVHPDAVIIFPDGRLLKGPQGLREYYDMMLRAPGHRVQSFSADPVVESRTVHDDVGLSYGQMRDTYVLTDGAEFGLNSRFTATLFRSSGGPPETDGWMIRSFHCSTDTFDNEVLKMAVGKTAMTSGVIGGAVGLILGILGTVLLRRRRRGAVGGGH